MKYLALSLIALLLGTLIASGQQETWDLWDDAVIEKANTAKNGSYYNDEEKEVVQLMNLSRIDGKLFASTFLTYYIQSNGMTKNSYVNSLFRDLKSVSKLPVLVPKKDLSDIADGHATKSGKTGHVGHKDMQKRFKPIFGSAYYSMAENCSYGYSEAMDIVITLLIDDGIKSLGHRKNILNESYSSVGVAIRPHKEYQDNCVIDFGGRSY
jgi:uncharacterized protein YkwD